MWARRIENSEDIFEWPETVFEVYPEPVAPVREIPQDKAAIAPGTRCWDQDKYPTENDERNSPLLEQHFRRDLGGDHRTY